MLGGRRARTGLSSSYPAVTRRTNLRINSMRLVPTSVRKKPAGEVADPLSCPKYRNTEPNVKSKSSACQAITGRERRKYHLCR
jgi:hypothetical protein